MQAKVQDSYNRASNIANQAISQVRTVAAYGQEETHIKEYDDQLEQPMQVSTRAHTQRTWHSHGATLINVKWPGRAKGRVHGELEGVSSSCVSSSQVAQGMPFGGTSGDVVAVL